MQFLPAPGVNVGLDMHKNTLLYLSQGIRLYGDLKIGTTGDEHVKAQSEGFEHLFKKRLRAARRLDDPLSPR